MNLRDTPEEASFRADLRAWLDANPDQVIMLYLENQLTDESGGNNQQAHDIAASIIADPANMASPKVNTPPSPPASQ